MTGRAETELVNLLQAARPSLHARRRSCKNPIWEMAPRGGGSLSEHVGKLRRKAFDAHAGTAAQGTELQWNVGTVLRG